MLKHHKIKNLIVDKNWSILKKTINKVEAANASEIIGEYAASDMIDFGNISKPDINMVYVKYRDGLHFAKGIRNIFKKADIRYIVTQRSGSMNEKVSIDFWGPYDGHTNELVWFADPVNARGTTAIITMDHLRKFLQYDTILLSHIVANKVGIKSVQTKITDFHINGYMNYAFKSVLLNQKTGYLEDGLDFIPDYGDKVFGTLGEDYPSQKLQQDVISLLGTQAGRESIIRASILFLLQKRWSDECMVDRKVVFPTRLWINTSLLWYSKIRKIPHLLDKDLIERNMKLILYNLEKEGFISSDTFPLGKSTIKYYKITEEGLKYTINVYNPVLAKENIAQRLKSNFNFLAHHEPQDIYNAIKAESGC